MDKEMYEELLKTIHNIMSENQNLDVERSEAAVDQLLSLDMKTMNEQLDRISKTKVLKYRKISEKAVAPNYVYLGDSGFDLYSISNVVIPPFGRAKVPTGITLEFDSDCEIQIRPKSGLADKFGLTVLNTPGTIDSGYLGEIIVILFNTSDVPVEIKEGMKIAQAVLCPVYTGRYVSIEQVETISNKDRGENGFGSTGLFKQNNA